MMKAGRPYWAEPLKSLKAEDLDKLWFDLYYCDVKWEAKQRISNMLMKFDETIPSRINLNP